MSQHKGYSMDRMHLTPSGNARTLPTQPIANPIKSTRYVPSSTSYPASSTTRITPSRPVANAHPPSTTRSKIPFNATTPGYSDQMHRGAVPMLQTKAKAHKLLRGVIIATPQNETTPGWIYCKSTNDTYRLPWSATAHYMVDQIVLFRPKSMLQRIRCVSMSILS